MAKVTVEDCLIVIPNRFELTLIAANRSRELIKERQALKAVKRDEKPTVTALREIAAGMLSVDKLNALRHVKK